MSKKKAKPKFIVVQDTREQQGYHFTESEFCDGMVRKALPTGDYAIQGFENLLVVERKKSTAELYKNIFESRFERELDRLLKYRYRVLLLEFSWVDVMFFPTNSGIPKAKWPEVSKRQRLFQRRVLEIQMRGIHVVYAGNAYNAQEYLLHLFKIMNEKFIYEQS